ncbi:MAG: hypothetical protein K8S56_05265, partial [Candidatus Cloacimonetes bacterium]|nr:hypothetical protein [Candidatus Cloacimonadota bacterium]
MNKRNVLISIIALAMLLPLVAGERLSNNGSAAFESGLFYYKDGKFQRAKGEFESVIKEKPDHFGALVMMGELTLRKYNPNGENTAPLMKAFDYYIRA